MVIHARCSMRIVNMVKKLFFITLVVLGILGAIWTMRQQAGAAPSTAEVSQTPQPTAASQPSQINQDQLRYVEYTPSLYAQLANRRRVLFFAAGWCGTCQQAELDFEKRSAELPPDVTVFRVNYDAEKELNRKYGVTSQHTFVVVDGQGNMVEIWNGGDVDDIVKRLET